MSIENNPSGRLAIARGISPGSHAATRLKSELSRSIQLTDRRMGKLMDEMRSLEHTEDSGSVEEIELCRAKLELSEAGSQLDRQRSIWQSMETDKWRYEVADDE